MNNLRELIEEALYNYEENSLILNQDVEVSDSLKYHIENKFTLINNVFSAYSKNYFDLINEVRELYTKGLIELNEGDRLMVESDTGISVEMDGETIYLDAPFEIENELLQEAKYRGKNVNLNKPFRTSNGPKKFAVYVKKPESGVKKITFGDPNLKEKNTNKKVVKSFRARHKCSQKKDRTTAGYWFCNVSRYSKQLGLSSKNS